MHEQIASKWFSDVEDMDFLHANLYSLVKSKLITITLMQPLKHFVQKGFKTAWYKYANVT